MSEQNPHREAQAAIRWLQAYFKSLKSWIRELDGVMREKEWIPFEANRISTALGNGYQDNTEWVLNWISRHFYLAGSNTTLLIYLPLASNRANDEVDVFSYLIWCEHNASAPENGVPTYAKDWILGSPVIDFLRDAEGGDVRDVSNEVVRRSFKEVTRMRAMKIHMTEFGENAASVREKIEGGLKQLIPPADQ